MLISAVFLSFAVSFLISLWFIGRAGKFGLIDIPNTRSSHTVPTSRGGGIGIVIGALAALSACYLFGLAEVAARYMTIAVGFFAMAMLGFCSDRFNTSAIARIIFQVIIAVMMVWLVGCPASLAIGGLVIPFGRLGAVFSVIWLIAVTNFYNFMDGIDGLAAAQGMIAGIGVALFGAILGDRSFISMGLVLFGATAGFFILNFPPARIFMGDTGSYSLGLYIASFALIDKRLAVPIAMVLGVFLFDASVTLANRLVKGEEWYLAHRSHFYQRAVKLGYGHLRVTSILSAVMAILTALACAYLWALPAAQIIIVIFSFAILIALALWINLKESNFKKGLNRC